ncbi:6-phosphogluconolactonase [Marichromatium bheemlicum]|uniref:6-phosphogluconolactonase n=1 Tax=Marichromatium bheemlicum TaxID=365339 RepID=A0ABX1I8L0_9GAMM|nr:6-phosphogluconolactonase [Marichromatium bheemlicum]NKN33603.1 6-phosphogluconolactonase [Marichromatium bheemlicum]
MSVSGVGFQVHESPEALAEVVASRVLAAAQRAIAARGRFTLVLAGGGTPLRVYERLATSPADWSRWHLFHGDERCLPPEDRQRNSRAIAACWLDRIALPPGQHHPIPAELGAEEAAHRYAALIAPLLPFDLVLLGMGEDGHTASLFPGHALAQTGLTMAVHEAPKPPPDRVTLTPAALSATREALVLVTGAGKREALARWRAGDGLPVASVAAAAGAEVLVDAAAWG